MNKCWKFLSEGACERKHSLACTVFSFSKELSVDSVEFLLQKSKNIEPIKINNRASVRIFDDYCVKQDNRPVTKRLFRSKFRDHPARGIRSVLGEGVNTLVANKIRFPSHKLLALEYRHLERRSTLIFERISKKSASEHLAEYPMENHDNLITIFNFLHHSLSKGLFHGDGSITNMFFDEDFKHGVFIDFERAVKLNCTIEEGLAIQLATFSNTESECYMPAGSYQDIAIEYLQSKISKKPEICQLFLDFYTGNPKRLGKDAKLKRASLYNPDILLCLNK